MKNLLCILPIVAILLFSCNESGRQENPTSTPIDSTNVHGTAPADYSDTGNTKEMLPPEPTQGDRANTPDGDSAPSTW